MPASPKLPDPGRKTTPDFTAPDDLNWVVNGAQFDMICTVFNNIISKEVNFESNGETT